MAAERWAREAAVIAASLELKAFNIELRRIRAFDVRVTDGTSLSDPFVTFTLLECDDLSDAHKPTDRTPHIRNSRHPVWSAPCTLRVPAGSDAAYRLGRLQIEPSMWQLVRKYLTPERRESAERPPLLGMKLFDFDPDGQKRRENKQRDDLIGENSLRLGQAYGAADRLEMPCRAQQQLQQEKEDGERGGEDDEHGEAAAMGADPFLPMPPFSPTTLPRDSDVMTMTRLSFEYAIAEFIPPPKATLTLKSFTVEGELHVADSSTRRSPPAPSLSPPKPSSSSARSRPRSASPGSSMVTRSHGYAPSARPALTTSHGTPRANQGAASSASSTSPLPSPSSPSSPSPLRTQSAYHRHHHHKSSSPTTSTTLSTTTSSLSSHSSPRSAGRELRACGPYVRFVVREVNELPPPSARLPAASADKGASQPWLDRRLELRLPKGSPRPPMLRVQLYDQEASGGGGKGAICSAEVRLDGAEGSALVRLDHVIVGRDRRGRPHERIRHLAIRFSFHTTNDEPVPDDAPEAGKVISSKRKAARSPKGTSSTKPLTSTA